MNRIIKQVILGLALISGGLTGLKAQTSPGALPQPAPAFPATNAAANAASPHIVFATPVYDFGKVTSGEPVKYTYIFTNTGNAVLELTEVRPSCHCTTAGEFTRNVEPGKTGSIPIQFNSAGYPAGPVMRAITVACNDKTQPTVTLQLKGTIWKPIDLVPPYAILNTPDDAPAASTVLRLVNHTNEPITVSAPECNHRAFAVALTNTVPGKEFQLTVSLVPPLAATNISAQITLKTSSTNSPVISVPVYANIQPAVMVMPKPVILPPGPLPTPTPVGFTIQNNSTNTLTLSDPAISAKGVDVQIRAVQSGRLYAITLTFPQGFELQQGQPVTFTVKTSHPRFPVIEVPVAQRSGQAGALSKPMWPGNTNVHARPGFGYRPPRPPPRAPLPPPQPPPPASAPAPATGQ